MTPITQDLEISLNFAVAEAARRGHELVTVEHILYALLHNRAAARAIRACGGSIEKTREKLDSYFKEYMPNKPKDAGTMPQPTLGFQRVVQRAIQSVRSAGKKLANGENVLVAIFNERESFAVYFLHEQEIARFDVINFVSHRIVKDGIHLDDSQSDEDSPMKRGLPSGARRGRNLDRLLHLDRPTLPRRPAWTASSALPAVA